MANIITQPSGGSIYFDNGVAGSSSIPDLTSNSVKLSFDGGAGLNILSTDNTNDNRFTVNGNGGRLFTISDSSSGVIFTVNDAAGLPIIEVNSDITDVIKIGTYGTDTLVVDDTNVGIGTASPASKLDVNGGIKIGDDSTAASANNVGTLRYRSDANNSYVDMVMQTSATTYAWVNIKTNTW